MPPDSESSSTSCRTTSASPRHTANAWWWDVLRHGQQLEVRRGVRHRLGLRRGQGPHPDPRRRDRSDRSRSPTASRGITTIAFRSAPTRPAGCRRQRCTLISTTSWSTGGAPTPISTTAASSRSTRSRASGSRPVGVRRVARVRSHAGCTTVWSTGCASIIPTVSPIRAQYLDDLAELIGGGYVLVEKILEGDEQLPPSWATDGTTGYDALADIDRVFVDPDCSPRVGPHRRVARGDARPPSWADAHPRHQAAGHRWHPAVRGAPHRTRSPPSSDRRGRPRQRSPGHVDRRDRRAARLLPGLSLVPAAGPRALLTAAERGDSSPPRPRGRRSSTSCRSCPTPPTRRRSGSSRPRAW